jgi:hypothetical protein
MLIVMTIMMVVMIVIMTLLNELRIIQFSIYGAEPFLRGRQLCSYPKTSQYFMEPEGSLLYSQEPSTGPYPEPD